jgi:hypothetical protein
MYEHRHLFGGIFCEREKIRASIAELRDMNARRYNGMTRGRIAGIMSARLRNAGADYGPGTINNMMMGNHVWPTVARAWLHLADASTRRLIRIWDKCDTTERNAAIDCQFWLGYYHYIKI